jgi:hypothetical protein
MARAYRGYKFSTLPGHRTQAELPTRSKSIRESIARGLKSTPIAFIAVLRGQNLGMQRVDLGEAV